MLSIAHRGSIFYASSHIPTYYNGLPMKMTKIERQAVISLSSIMGLRMLGLFMVLPVFSLYAGQLAGATPALIGIAVSIYGLAQGLLQIPFGMLSDYFGRKPIILLGLIIFISGSLLAAFTHSIIGMIVGRALQGAGAVGSTILAMMADLTTEEHRTKAMAISGITIGGAFSSAILIGPLLIKWLAVNDLFFISGALGLIAIFILYKIVPSSITHTWHRDTEPELKIFFKLLFAPELLKLNCGIFFLHAIFTASFVVMPISFLHDLHLPAHEQWLLYFPTLIIASIVALVAIGFAERKQQIKLYFLGGITTLILGECLLWLMHTQIAVAACGLIFFFAGFTLLEALLPSLISREAPLKHKGSALGIYSCAQFLGIFTGGIIAGWLYGQFNLSIVYIFCVILALFWLFLAFLMQPPQHFVTQMLRLQQRHWDTIASQLERIPGMVEVTFIAEEGIAYLKMERGAVKHPDFIRLKEQLLFM